VSRFGITLKGTYQDVQITVADAAKFRVLPQPTFDDKGRIKPVKPDPQDPDRRLGGVKGSAEDLRKDVWVVANLSRTRSGGKHVAHAIVVLGEEAKK
jgi:hypothetical protein